MAEVSPGNAREARFWNAARGRAWVDHEAELDAVHAPALDLLLERAGLRSGDRVLDIGCGTGASSLAAARAVAPGGAVVGLDVAAQLLARARARAAEKGLGNAAFIEGDAQVQVFPEPRFDAAISRFGVMFFSDPVAAFASIARALRPGARLTFVAWAALGENPYFAVPGAAAVRRLGEGAPAVPGTPGPLAFQDRDRVAGLMGRAGLREISAERVVADLTPRGDVAEVVRLMTSIGPASRLLTELGGSAEDAAAIAADVAGGITRYATPQGVRIPATFNLFCAAAP